MHVNRKLGRPDPEVTEFHGVPPMPQPQEMWSQPRVGTAATSKGPRWSGALDSRRRLG
jgi:hypothetical protein